MTHDLGSMPLESLMRHTPLAIAATDATGCLTLLSPALQRVRSGRGDPRCCRAGSGRHRKAPADLESGTRLSKTHGNIAGLVRDVMDGFAARVLAWNLDLVAIAPDRLTATIDPDQVGRAVVELLDNAVTYAPPNSCIEVEVAATVDCVEIHVRDAGTGIAPADVSRLVQPFERGRHALQPVNSRGLDLAVAHTVATAHGGELLLDGQEPFGLCATLRLPRAEVPSASAGID